MIPRIFHLDVSTSDWSRYRIHGDASLRFPACVCDECGQRWFVVGESYPTVDSASLLREFNELGSTPLSADKWQVLRPRLANWFPRTARLRPGTVAGVFRGLARGKLNDFSWYEPWTVFFRSSVVDLLISRGVRLGRLVEAELRNKKDDTPIHGWFEPEAELRTELVELPSTAGSISECAKCGRRSGYSVKMQLADPTQIPTDVDIWRATNWPSRYLVSERLANAVGELELTGCLLRPLDN